jgi:hypothetical protein
MANATLPAKSVSGQAAAPAVASAFRSQTQPTIKRPGVALTATLGTSPVALSDTQIPPTTLLRCIYIETTVTGANTSATVAYNADAPLNVYSIINFHDAQGTSIVGSFDSFTLGMAQKYFGFTNNSDPLTSAVFTSTVGAVATGGSFKIVFRIPVEVVSRTGVGSQINTDTQSPLVLSLTANTTTAIYSTGPDGSATLSAVVSFGGYWNQSGNPNAFAVPTAVGSLNYINWTNYTGLSGQQQFQLSNIGLGNSVMNLMFINRLTSGSARSDSGFADPLQVAYRGNVLGSWSELLWKHLMSEAYGYSGTATTTSSVTKFALDTGLGTVVPSPTPSLNLGVYNLWFNSDFVFDPGNTLFYGMLNTAVGDSIELTGSWNTSSVLYEVINFLAVSGPLAAIQGH